VILISAASCSFLTGFTTVMRNPEDPEASAPSTRWPFIIIQMGIDNTRISKGTNQHVMQMVNERSDLILLLVTSWRKATFIVKPVFTGRELSFLLDMHLWRSFPRHARCTNGWQSGSLPWLMNSKGEQRNPVATRGDRGLATSGRERPKWLAQNSVSGTIIEDLISLQPVLGTRSIGYVMRTSLFGQVAKLAI
jgi:hypothetical protein